MPGREYTTVEVPTCKYTSVTFNHKRTVCNKVSPYIFNNFHYCREHFRTALKCAASWATDRTRTVVHSHPYMINDKSCCQKHFLYPCSLTVESVYTDDHCGGSYPFHVGSKYCCQFHHFQAEGIDTSHIPSGNIEICYGKPFTDADFGIPKPPPPPTPETMTVKLRESDESSSFHENLFWMILGFITGLGVALGLHCHG